jgi:hypothetical protein
MLIFYFVYIKTCLNRTCVRNRQVFDLYKLYYQRFPTVGLYFRVWFIQDSSLFKDLVYTGFTVIPSKIEKYVSSLY